MRVDGGEDFLIWVVWKRGNCFVYKAMAFYHLCRFVIRVLGLCLETP